jgi:uncharacterized protein (DUF1015 family)
VRGGDSEAVVDLDPVRAWHPNPEVVPTDQLVCPVYDTLSDEELRRYAGHPYNAARFVPRPRELPLEEFVASAVGRLGEALRSRAYVRDDRPAYYVYGIRYVPPPDILETIEPAERRAEYLLLGLVGAIDLQHLAHATVALHERTFADRVAERVSLTDATGMNFAPIMLGYHLPDHRLNDRLERLLGLDRRGLSFEGSVPPVAEAVLDGTTHRLWKIDGPEAIEAIRSLVRPLRLLVLDGHHRFTAAAKRQHEGLRSAPLSMLVDGQDRALRVLPWHRVLPGDVQSLGELVRAARSNFPSVSRLAVPASPAATIDHLRSMHRTGRRGFLASDGEDVYEIQGASSADVGADFDLLHAFLEERLGIDPHELEFVRSPRAAFERIRPASDSGPVGSALLLPPLTEQGIEDRAFGAAAVMAHKSTMFLPKVAEGMIFAPADGTG